jgi:hypothetical protein
VKLRREAKILHDKALASLRRAVGAFNSYDDSGRSTAVLRDLQHAFEMILKAALVQRGRRVFDRKSGTSIGFDKCVHLTVEALGLDEQQAGTLRAIDALRDEEQHWFAHVTEGLLYAHARAGVTLFDEVLTAAFDERLVDHLPHRVLPLSSEPPRDMQILIDEEYTQIAQLLEPGRRRRPEARARIRALLAMEAHAAEGVKVSKRDVDRVERAIKTGTARPKVFPRLGQLSTEVSGDGIEVRVRFVKSVDAAPVRLVAADEDVDAAAVREVDLQRKYHWSPSDLADKLGLTGPRAVALRRHLGIDDDEACVRVFTFGSQKHTRYSDNALTRMRAALLTVDMDQVWSEHRPRRSAA